MQEKPTIITTIPQFFERQAKKTPDKIAISFNQQSLTYRELNQQANQLAHYLQTFSLRPEALIGICVKPSLHSIIGILAILKTGAAYVPIDPNYPTQRIDYILNDSNIAILLTEEELKSQFSNLKIPCICIDDNDVAHKKITKKSKINLAHYINGDSLAYIIYTSGSTGNPKGVLITHSNVVRLFKKTQLFFNFNEQDIWTLFHSIAFDFSVWETWGALFYGGELVIVPYEITRSTIDFYQLLIKKKVTVLNQTPMAFKQLIIVDENKPAEKNGLNLRYIIFGGEALNIQTLLPWLKRHGDRQPQLINMYGITEITVHATLRPITIADLQSPLVSPIGKPLADLQAYVLDSDLSPSAVGESGELYIAGPGLARGYFNRPELTEERFLKNPFGKDKMYKSGDLVRLTSAGELDYLGRSDHQVKIRGFRIELGEIEAKIQLYENVAQVVVIAREDIPDSKYLAAYLVLQDPDKKIILPKLYAHLKTLLPEYMVPNDFVILERLPLTPHGKVDLRALPKPERSDLAISSDFVAAKTQTEKNLVEIWKKILNISKIGIKDNFFELGGHSLQIIEFINTLHIKLNITLPMRAIFDAPTIAELTKVIDNDLKKLYQVEHPLVEPQAHQQSIPLAYVQEGLWFVEQLGASPAYNVPFAYLIRGKIDVHILTNSLNKLANRHSLLKTTFISQASGPTQIINPQLTINLAKTDLSNEEIGVARKKAHTVIRDFIKEKFDLDKGPLLRAQLITIANKKNILVFNIHHIIYDAWSIPIFLRELSEIYQAESNHCTENLPSLSISYADFAIWQRKWLQDNRLHQLKKYWQENLKDCSPLLDLPFDFPRPQVYTFEGDEFHFHINKNVTQAFMQLMQANQSTFFMGNLAVFSVLLNKYTHQNDILIGTPIANRHYQGIENLIGFFTNTVVMRCQLAENLTVKQWLGKIRETALNAYAHQDLPFIRLVELLQPTSANNYNPFFQVLLVVFDEDEETLKLRGTTATPIQTKTNTSKFDLTLFVRKTNKGIHAWIEYNTNLFTQDTIKNIARNFTTLFFEFTKSPEKLLFNLNSLPDCEKDFLLTLLNSTQTHFPQNKGIHQLVEEKVVLIPHQTALEFGKTHLTYQELNQKANALAHQLIGQGIKTNDIIGILAEPSLDMIIGLLAALKANAAYLPLDPTNPKLRLKTIIEDSGAKIILVQKKLSDKLPTSPTKTIFFSKNTDHKKINISNPDLLFDPNNSAYIIYTSGTTGKPKGIDLSHQTLTNLIQWQFKKIFNAERVALFSNFSFDVATQTIFYSLVAGSNLHIIPNEIKKDPFALLLFLQEKNIDIIFLPPAVLQNLAETFLIEQKPLTTLRHIIVAGNALHITPALRQFFLKHPACKLTNQYGPSETHVATSYDLAGDPLQWPTLPSIGKPIDNAQIYILNQFLNPVPLGAIGELYIGGVMLAKGYIGQSELTANKFIKNPFQNNNSRLYRSNDLARFHQNGDIEFIGRADYQVKIRGFRVELDEITAQLKVMDTIQQAVTLLREDMPNHAKLVSYLVVKQPKNFDVENLSKQLSQFLPSYMLPDYFIILDKMPLTSNGKIDRKALPAPAYRNIKTHKNYVAPKTVLEAELCQYWAELLNVERVGITDNFLELGGYSLLTTKLLLHIRLHYSATIPLNQFFLEPTVSTLIKLIKHKTNHKPLVNKEVTTDLLLNKKIKPLAKPLTAASLPKAILLTGANGFLGTHLLHELLKKTNATIYCLVRGKNQQQASQRLIESLEAYHFENLETNVRIIPVLGDLTQPQFGISDTEFSMLAETIDSIYHNGAFVHHIYNYDKLRAANVLSTIELIKFSALKRSKRLHFISTVATASDPDTSGRLQEDFPSAKSTRPESGYVTSKWVAERLLAQAKDRGFAVSVYRPGYITGQTLTGIGPTKDNHLLMFIKGCVQLGVAPNNWGSVDMLPVDFLAEAIVAISLQQASQGRVFNLNNPQQPTWNDIFTWVNAGGFPLRLLKVKEWRDQYLVSIDENNALYPLLPLYISKEDPSEQEKSEVKNDRTRSILKQLQLPYPSTDQALFTIYLQYLAPWLREDS